MTENTEVAAIYFPGWHREPRWVNAASPDFTEWDLVKAGRPRFDGHHQPIVPAFGYVDETETPNMQRSCDLAAGAGINAFLWDWYWYDGDDFLNRPLNETFLKLPNPGIKFALMWANHDWVDVFPAHAGVIPEPTWKGAIELTEFDRMIEIIVHRYLTQDSYWRVNNCAWFTIFRLNELVNGLGGISQTHAALLDFRDRARAAGAGELHLNAMGGYGDYSSEELRDLGIDSVGTYGWTESWSETPVTTLTTSYSDWRAGATQFQKKERERLSLNFIPSVAMGWDSTLRVDQAEEIVLGGWPYYPVVVDNTPEEFGDAILAALTEVDEYGGTNVITVNAWNEWTEGSYLEPDSRTGDAHLRALAKAISQHRK